MTLIKKSTGSHGEDSPKHADLVNDSVGSSSNPIAHSVTVLLPERMEIRLVEASTLGEYEHWSFLTTILSDATVGFLVAWILSPSILLGIISLVFLLLASYTFRISFLKRRLIYSQTRSIPYRLGEQMPISNNDEEN